MAYTDLHCHAEALSAGRRAVELAPEGSLHHTQLGTALWNTDVRDHDFGADVPAMHQAAQPALEAVQHALYLDPFNTVACIVLAHFYMSLDEPAEAEPLFVDVLMSDPANTFACLGLAQIALHNRLFDIAQTHIETVLKTDPHSTEALAFYAHLKLDQGEPNQAFRIIFTALPLNPTDQNLHRSINSLLQKYFTPLIKAQFRSGRFLLIPFAPVLFMPLYLAFIIIHLARNRYLMLKLEPDVRKLIKDGCKDIAPKNRRWGIPVDTLLVVSFVFLPTSFTWFLFFNRASFPILLVNFLCLCVCAVISQKKGQRSEESPEKLRVG